MTRGGTLPEREREDAIGRADAQLEIQSWYCPYQVGLWMPIIDASRRKARSR
jgi:hypothetical protein